MKSSVDFANKVKEYTAAGKSIAPVENGETAVGSYAIGDQFMREGVLYKAKTTIDSGDSLVLDTNYELEDDVTTQLSSVKQALSNEAETRAKLGVHNLFDLEGWLNKKGVTYTKSGNSYTFTVGANTGNNNAYKFSSTPITVDLSSTITAGTALNVGFRFIKNGEVVSQKITNGTIEADSVYIDYSSAGTATFTDVMLKLHTDSYLGFTPYVPTNAELLSMKTNRAVGAHNILPLDVATIKSLNTTGVWTGNDFVPTAQPNLTWKLITNSNGNIIRIDAVGTTTSATTFILSKAVLSNVNISDTTSANMSDGVVTISSQENCAVGGYGHYIGYGVSDHTTMLVANYLNNATYSYYPMLRSVDDPDTSFAPYAMTNRELTALCSLGALLEKKTILTSSDDMDNITDSGVYETTGTAIPANYPEAGSNNAVIFVMGLDSKGYVVQIWISRNSSKIYYRWYTRTSSPQWGRWYAISGTSL